MKKILFLAASLFVASFAFLSCDDEETYAEQKEREARQIKDWLADNHISVISMSEFLKDSVTDTTLNEYVLFEDNGVYMQIVNRGGARLIESGETWYISARLGTYRPDMRRSTFPTVSSCPLTNMTMSPMFSTLSVTAETIPHLS